MRSYVLCCDESFWAVTEVADWADRSPIVRHWRHDMAGCVYLLSESSARALSEDFVKSAGRRVLHLITEVTGEIAGVMLPETWSMLHDKRPLGISAPAEQATRPAQAR